MSAIHVTNLLHTLRPTPGTTLRTITITASAATLESLGAFTLSPNTKSVLLAVRTAPMNIDPTGGAPTISVGVPYYAGQIIQLSLHEAKLANWILASATSGTVTLVEYSV